jgi:hypothetical protein
MIFDFKNQVIRIGFGAYFIQVNYDYWWQFMIRFGNSAIGINKTRGLFTRRFKQR